MKAIIDKNELARRCMCMRKWYFGRKDSRCRSIERRKVLMCLNITSDKFYELLRGRTYINDDYAHQINIVVNRAAIPGYGVDIFAK